MKKTLKILSKQKIYPKKKKKPKFYVFGWISRIPYDPMILHDLTYDPTIFTILVRS